MKKTKITKRKIIFIALASACTLIAFGYYFAKKLEAAFIAFIICSIIASGLLTFSDDYDTTGNACRTSIIVAIISIIMAVVCMIGCFR